MNELIIAKEAIGEPVEDRRAFRRKVQKMAPRNKEGRVTPLAPSVGVLLIAPGIERRYTGMERNQRGGGS